MSNGTYTLITNIERVRRRGDALMMTCYALLITSKPLVMASIRGFYADPAAPVFTFNLDTKTSFSYVVDFVPPVIDPGWNCFGQYTLNFAGGLMFELLTLNSKCPIDVATYTGDIYQVWADLRDKVAKYWDSPAMPVVDYLPPAVVLRLDNMYRRRLLDEQAERT